MTNEANNGWRPMSTAPEDGVFLVWLEEPLLGSRVRVARWHPNGKSIGGVFNYDAPKPLFWKPLPCGPDGGLQEEQEQEQEQFE